MTDKLVIDKAYLKKLELLKLPKKGSTNEWTVLHMYGDGKQVSKKFNFQVYKDKKGILTLVTNDFNTLDRLLAGEKRVSEEGKRVILIDDSGWGFPLGGVLCGAYDLMAKRFYWREVETKYFQGTEFQEKCYLERFKERALELIDEINPNKKETIIKICTGYINSKAKEELRKHDFLVVEVDEIGEPLQSLLETQHREYIKNLVGKDRYYDPKTVTSSKIAKKFDYTVNFAKENNLMHLVKTGWKCFSDVEIEPKSAL